MTQMMFMKARVFASMMLLFEDMLWLKIEKKKKHSPVALFLFSFLSLLKELNEQVLKSLIGDCCV